MSTKFQPLIKNKIQTKEVFFTMPINVKMQTVVGILTFMSKVRKRAKIRNRYSQASHLTQDTNGKGDITNESQEVSPFPAGDH